MTKINSEDFGQPVHTTEPFTPEPLVLPDADGAFGFKFHDRQGVDYHLLMCRPSACDGQHAIIVGYVPLPGIGVLPLDLPVSDPHQFGERPTTAEEALAWTKRLLQAWQDFGDLLKGKQPIVMEPYQGS